MDHRRGIQTCMFLLLLLPLMGCGEGEKDVTDTDSIIPSPQDESIDFPQAPPFTLPDLNGNMVSLADLEGKVILLDFFATWCAPCRVEIPGFIELYHKYQSRGFVVVGISTDRLGLEVVKPFVEELGIDYPVLIGNQEVMETYRVIGLPTNFILDRRGRSRKFHVGIQPKEVFEKEILDVLNP